MPGYRPAAASLALTLALAAAACTGGVPVVKGGRSTASAAPTTAPATPATLVKSGGQPLVAAGATLAGVVTAPAQVVSNDGGSIVAQGGGNAIAPGHHHLLAVTERPLANTAVYLADAAGQPIPGLPVVHTDAKGAYHFDGVLAGGPLQVVALGTTAKGTVRLATLAPANANTGADISLGSTLVSAAVIGNRTAVPAVDAAAFAKAAATTDAKIGNDDMPDLTSRLAVLASLDLLMQQTHDVADAMKPLGVELAQIESEIKALGGKLDDLKHELDGVASGVAQVDTKLDQVASQVAAIGDLLKPSPTPTPLASPSGIPPQFKKLPLAVGSGAGGDSLGEGQILAVGPDGVWADLLNGFTTGGFARLNPTDGTPTGRYATANLQPRAAAFDAAGNLWVADAYAGSAVRISSADGGAIWQLDWTTSAAKGGTATGLDVAKDGTIWFAAVNLVARFGSDGTFLNAVNPTDGANGVAANQDGTAWVSLGSQVVKYDAKFKVLASATGLPNPGKLAGNGQGEVWVRTGTGLAKIDGSGNVAFTLDNSRGYTAFAVDAGGNCWAADPNGQQVQEYDATGAMVGKARAFTGNFGGIAAGNGHVYVLAGGALVSF